MRPEVAKKISVHEIVGPIPLQKARLDSGPLAVVADDDAAAVAGLC